MRPIVKLLLKETRKGTLFSCKTIPQVYYVRYLKAEAFRKARKRWGREVARYVYYGV